MKIVWLNHRDIKHPRAGGAERTIFEIGKRLAKMGHSFISVSASVNNRVERDVIENIEFTRFPGNIQTHLRVPSLLKRENADVVVDDLAHVVPWWSERFFVGHGAVFFRHLHSRTLPGQVSKPLSFVLSQLEKNYKRFYREWPFVTESLQGIEDLKRIGIPGKRINRILPGVDTDRFKPKVKFESPTMVYFGGLRDYKRPYEALHLLKALLPEYQELRLLVIGEGPSRNRMGELATQLGINRKVDFMGHVDENTLSEILAKSWVNLHFSVAEGWGYSILEASASGTPTVAYDVPGVSEVIEESLNGFKISGTDRTEMADKVSSLLNKPDQLVNTSRMVSEKYSWDDSARSWNNFFHNL